MARQPKNPFHPGEILLEEFLEPMGVTQATIPPSHARNPVIGSLIASSPNTDAASCTSQATCFVRN